MRTRTFRANELVRVAHPSSDEPLAVGDRVRLNSGGPVSLVVDLAEAEATIAWKINERIEERILARVCLSRCN